MSNRELTPSKSQKKIINEVVDYISDNPKGGVVDKPFLVDLISGAGKSAMIPMILRELDSRNKTNKTLIQHPDLFYAQVSSTIRLTLPDLTNELKNMSKTPNVYITPKVPTVYSLCGASLVSGKKLIRGKHTNKFGAWDSASWLSFIKDPEIGLSKRIMVLFIDEASTISKDQWKLIKETLDEHLETARDNDRLVMKIVMLGDSKQIISFGKTGSYVFDKLKPVYGKVNSNETRRHSNKKFNKFIVKLRKNSGKRVQQIPKKVGKVLKCVSSKRFDKELKKKFTALQKPLFITYTNDRASKISNHIDEEYFNKNITLASGSTVEVKSNGWDTSYIIDKLYEIKEEGLHFIVFTSVNRAGTIKMCGNVKTANYVRNTIALDVVNGNNKLEKFLRKHNMVHNENMLYNLSINTFMTFIIKHTKTVHSVQGQTNRNVFVDLKDPHISSMSRNEFSRWLYVSISRCSGVIFINGKVPKSLLGKI